MSPFRGLYAVKVRPVDYPSEPKTFSGHFGNPLKSSKTPRRRFLQVQKVRKSRRAIGSCRMAQSFRLYKKISCRPFFSAFSDRFPNFCGGHRMWEYFCHILAAILQRENNVPTLLQCENLNVRISWCGMWECENLEKTTFDNWDWLRPGLLCQLSIGGCANDPENWFSHCHIWCLIGSHIATYGAL